MFDDNFLEALGTPIQEEQENGGAVIPTAPPTPPTTQNENPPAPDNPPPVIPTTEPAKTILPHEVFGDDYKDKDWAATGEDVKAKLQKVSEYETEIEKLRSTPPSFASDTVAKYDAWVRNGGIEDFSIFNVVSGFKPEMNDIDALVAKRIIENPKLLGSEKYIKEGILKQYPTTDEDGNPLDAGQVSYNQGLLAGEAVEAKKFIQSQAAKMQVQQSAAPVNKEELLATRTTAWTSAGEQLSAKLKTIPVSIPVEKDGKTVDEKILDFAISEAEVTAEVKELAQFYSKHVDVNQQTLIEMEIQAKQNILLKKIPLIIKAALDGQRATIVDEYDKKYAGAVLPDPGSAPPASFKAGSNDEHIQSVL